MRTLTLRHRFAALASALLVVAALLATTPGSVTASSSSFVPAIDNSNRVQVGTTYRNAIEANRRLAANWNGSVGGCSAGSASSSFDTATVESINWFRSMVGLGNVVEDHSQSADAQRAALMMDAQNQLSHSPSSSWNCYSSAGAIAASNSNLALGVNGTNGVISQVEDPGAANAALGHRRWLLFPELRTVGIGNTSRASSVQVINDFGQRVSETNWVAWPPEGFVPDDVIFDRWSISYGGGGDINFSNARVSVTENGRALPVSLLPVVEGFGDPTLGFEVPTANPTAAGDTVYRVSITGVTINGRRTDRSYTVTAFDALATGFGLTCNGRPATIVGTDGADVIQGTSGKDVIVGLDGNDRIEGLGGNDIVCGGRGNDTIFGGSGNDILLGARGHDHLQGSVGNDVLLGGDGKDTLYGQEDRDRIIGGDHADLLSGGTGVDQCWGTAVNSPSASNDNGRCENGR